MRTSTEPDVDAALAIRNHDLAVVRAALSSLARTHGFLTHHLCGCGRPSCPNDNPETVSLAVLLRAVATEWVGLPEPSDELELREQLLAFASTFGLDVCPSGDPDCHCVHLGQSDTREVVRTIADAWHGRAGNPGPIGEDAPITSDVIADLADDHAHNLRVLDALAFFLDPERGPALLNVVAAARRAEGGPWLDEARAMASEALASWLPNPTLLPEVGRVLDSALAVAFHADWTTADAADLERAAADACTGVLVRGIAHESVTEVLFAPLTAVVALSDFDAFADMEILAAA